MPVSTVMSAVTETVMPHAVPIIMVIVGEPMVWSIVVMMVVAVVGRRNAAHLDPDQLVLGEKMGYVSMWMRAQL